MNYYHQLSYNFYTTIFITTTIIDIIINQLRNLTD